MRLFRFGEPGLEEPGVELPDGRWMDASEIVRDYNEFFFGNGGLNILRSWIEEGCPGGQAISPTARIGPPVRRPSKIVCVGKNYLDHALEFGEGVPSEPVLFM